MGMTDLRARLAEVLRKEAPSPTTASQDDLMDRWVDRVADVLLSLPGIEIVEVPEYAYVSVRYSRDGMIARLNAKEEAAANAAGNGNVLGGAGGGITNPENKES
jgi:hypothetical protein